MHINQELSFCRKLSAWEIKPDSKLALLKWDWFFFFKSCTLLFHINEKQLNVFSFSLQCENLRLQIIQAQNLMVTGSTSSIKKKKKNLCQYMHEVDQSITKCTPLCLPLQEQVRQWACAICKSSSIPLLPIQVGKRFTSLKGNVNPTFLHVPFSILCSVWGPPLQQRTWACSGCLYNRYQKMLIISRFSGFVL